MNKSNDNICSYCENSVDRTTEHLLSRCISPNETRTPFVCFNCNQNFSEYEKALKRGFDVLRMKKGFTKRKNKKLFDDDYEDFLDLGQTFHLNEQLNIHEVVVLNSDIEVKTLPQLIFINDSNMQFFANASEKEKAQKIFLKLGEIFSSIFLCLDGNKLIVKNEEGIRFAKKRQKTIYIRKVFSNNIPLETFPPRIIITPYGEVEIWIKEDKQLLGLLQKISSFSYIDKNRSINIDDFRTELVVNPNVIGTLDFNVNQMSRGALKNALNILFHYKPELRFNTEFTTLKEYLFNPTMKKPDGFIMGTPSSNEYIFPGLNNDNYHYIIYFQDKERFIISIKLLNLVHFDFVSENECNVFNDDSFIFWSEPFKTRFEFTSWLKYSCQLTKPTIGGPSLHNATKQKTRLFKLESKPY